MHYEKWWANEGRCPVAISLGHEPLLFAFAGLEIPFGISEYNYAGAVIGDPVDVVAAPKTGLPVPAAAEAVLEGWIYPDRKTKEGPFGEWTGYYTGGQRSNPAPILEVDTILHRKNPILLGAPPGKPPHDYSYMKSVMKSAMIQDALVRAGLRGVRGRVGARMRRRALVDRRFHEARPFAGTPNRWPGLRRFAPKHPI